MAIHSLKVNTQISLEQEKDKDIITLLEDLKEGHRIGQFLGDLVKAVVDNPYGIKAEDFVKKYNADNIRNTYFKFLDSEMKQIRSKVDEMYKMVTDMYILTKFGKHIGLEGKTENVMSAQFIVEKQLKEIERILGVNLRAAYESDKIQDITELAESALEYIINTYSGIVGEIKNNQEAVTVAERIVERPVEKIDKQSDIELNKEDTETEQVDSEYVDFGEADLSALSNFFGE